MGRRQNPRLFPVGRCQTRQVIANKVTCPPPIAPPKEGNCRATAK